MGPPIKWGLEPHHKFPSSAHHFQQHSFTRQLLKKTFPQITPMPRISMPACLHTWQLINLIVFDYIWSRSGASTITSEDYTVGIIVCPVWKTVPGACTVYTDDSGVPCQHNFCWFAKLWSKCSLFAFIISTHLILGPMPVLHNCTTQCFHSWTSVDTF